MDNSQQSPGSNIFSDSFGRPLRIFVEASSVVERPKLIRLLRTHGAQIEQWVKNSDIILVDETVPDSLIFAAQWPQKHALSYRWAHQAVRDGRCRGASENWGGHLVRVEVPDAPDRKSPLPTPRQTPIAEGYPAPLPSGTPIPAPLQRASGSPAFFPNADQPPPYSIQLPPQAAVPIVNPDASGYSVQSVPSIVPNLAAAPAPVLQTLLDMLARGAANSIVAPYQQIPNPQLQFTAPYPTAASSSANFVAVPNTQLAYTQSLQEPSNSSSLQQTSQAIYRGSQCVSRSATPDLYAQSGSGKRKSTHRDEPSASAQLRTKGKTRAETPEPPRKQRHHTEEREQPERSHAPIKSDPNDSNGVAKIFTKKHGQSLRFVVDMAVRNRRDVLVEIKKYGGTIVPDIVDADYVILSPHADNFENELRQTLVMDIPAVLPDFIYSCVQEGTILDEEEFSYDGVLVKGKRGKPNYPIDLAAMRAALRPAKPEPRKRGRPKAANKDRKKTTSKKTPRVVSTASSASPAQARNKSAANISAPESHSVAEGAYGTSQSSSVQQPDLHDIDGHHDIPRSPSPTPPASLKVVESGGKARFTSEDEDYFTIYVAHLLRHDPHISTKHMAEKLHQKLSHHSQGSWANYCRKKYDDVELVRRRAFIAWRKRESSAPTNAPAVTNVSSVTQEMPVSNFIVEDLDIIVGYLSGGVPEGLSDDEAFKQLALQVGANSHLVLFHFLTETSSILAEQLLHGSNSGTTIMKQFCPG
ncbi:hypothetical protein NM688_g5190 [Phlebia brevispora]|uniref:Uncharacterized protein n=1 Tax=Phlebia brevispora TaxID=194682 RepID=A0ACC1SYX5_9APHY|nr:hypothetical protein NM688_g5190 [Phlebia brevispora]